MTTIMLLPETTQENVCEIDGKIVEHSNYSPFNIIEDPHIADPVFKHLTETCTTRERAIYNCINKAWKTLLLDNMLSATYKKMDWYFPIRSKATCSKQGGRHVHKRTWSGVHHPSLEFQTLPHIPETIVVTDSRECSDYVATYSSASTLLAVAGGLMLFGDGVDYIDKDWRPLSVYNPLTNESRELPKLPTYHELSDDLPMMWNVLDMVVDEKARSYKVILTFINGVIVYDSTSNSWSVRRFLQEAPLALESPAKAIVNGKLQFAELEINGEAIHDSEGMLQAQAHVAVFEVDEDAGTWKQSMRVPLRDYFSATFDEFMDGSSDIALVECMGRLFALIPALLDLHKTVEKEIMQVDRIVQQAGLQTYNDYGYLPLQFYMLPLGGGGGGVRQLRIRPLETSLEDCRRMAMDYLEEPREADWVHCHSHGSVIWLTFENYLLQYDMVSGGSQTFTLPRLYSHYHADHHTHPGFIDYYEKREYNASPMFYSPNFFVKP